MTEVIKLHFPEISGDAATYTAWIRHDSSGTLLNTGGSVITETAGTGLWTFSTPDRTPCTDYRVRVYAGPTETPTQLVFDGKLTANMVVVDTDFGPTQHVIRGIVGNAVVATTTTMTPSTLLPAGNASNQFVGRILVFDNNTITPSLRGQATAITANTAGTLPLFTVQELTTAPAFGDSFSIV